MNRFVHIGFAFAGVPKMRDLEPAIANVSEDWIRYSSHCWILWTSAAPMEILAAIMPCIDHMDNALITVMSTNETVGRMPPWAWGWMNSKGFIVKTGPEVDQLLYLPRS